MISDEREFRRYYNDNRKQDRDRDSFRDRNNKNFSADRYDRKYDYSTGYNHSRDYGSHQYDRRSQNGGDRYDNRDYRYSYGDERDYDRYRDENRSWHEGNGDQSQRRTRDFRDDYYGNEREYPETPYRGRDYQDDRYENPGLSDRYPDRNRGRYEEDREERMQNRGQRIQWDPADVDRRNQYGTGMDRYRARYRQETLYGGRTEKHSDRNAHSGGSDARGFMERTSDRVRSWFDEDDRDRNRNRSDRNRY